jgi:hypothetical protein
VIVGRDRDALVHFERAAKLLHETNSAQDRANLLSKLCTLGASIVQVEDDLATADAGEAKDRFQSLKNECKQVLPQVINAMDDKASIDGNGLQSISQKVQEMHERVNDFQSTL